jgi:hypothetical protein
LIDRERGREGFYYGERERSFTTERGRERKVLYGEKFIIKLKCSSNCIFVEHLVDIEHILRYDIA